MDQRHVSELTFDTALGRCAVRWTAAGIAAVLLPHVGGRAGPRFEDIKPADDGADSVDAADAQDPGRLPAFVRRAIEGMQATMAGEAPDLRDIPLDEAGLDELRRAVYAATREVPPGRTRSYGEIARTIGRPDAARDVGAALARNPYPILVPCHRVVAANGALTGFSAPGGLATKRRMLELEGAPGYGQQVLFG